MRRVGTARCLSGVSWGAGSADDTTCRESSAEANPSVVIRHRNYPWEPGGAPQGTRCGLSMSSTTPPGESMAGSDAFGDSNLLLSGGLPGIGGELPAAEVGPCPVVEAEAT